MFGDTGAFLETPRAGCPAPSSPEGGTGKGQAAAERRDKLYIYDAAAVQAKELEPHLVVLNFGKGSEHDGAVGTLSALKRRKVATAVAAPGRAEVGDAADALRGCLFSLQSVCWVKQRLERRFEVPRQAFSSVTMVRFCSGMDGVACRFRNARPGTPAQPSPGQAMCILCDLGRLSEWIARKEARPKLLQWLRRLKQNEEAYEAALARLGEVTDAVEELEDAVNQTPLLPIAGRGQRKGKGKGKASAAGNGKGKAKADTKRKSKNGKGRGS
eukprot:s5992_g3.t1